MWKGALVSTMVLLAFMASCCFSDLRTASWLLMLPWMSSPCLRSSLMESPMLSREFVAYFDDEPFETRTYLSGSKLVGFFGTS